MSISNLFHNNYYELTCNKLSVIDNLFIDGFLTFPSSVISDTAPFAGGAKGVPSFNLKQINSDLVLISCHRLRNNQGDTTGSIFSNVPVIPSTLRPAVDQFIPIIVIVNDGEAVGILKIHQDGNITVYYSFTTAQYNGWEQFSVLYSLQ